MAARRRAREATRRANETRAARDKANIENAATYMVAKAKLAEIDAWETERLAAVTEQVRTEAGKRRTGTRAEAGAAIRQLQARGETLTTIAELTGDSIVEVRATLRHMSTDEKATATDSSSVRRGCGDAESAVNGGSAAASFRGSPTRDPRGPIGDGLGSDR